MDARILFCFIGVLLRDSPHILSFLGIPWSITTEGDRTVGMGMRGMSRPQRTGIAVGGCVGLVGGLALRGAAGSPVPVLRLMGADALLPPLWLMGFLWLIGYVLVGCAAGYLSVCPSVRGRREALLWRGGTFLAMAVGLSFCWYSCLFASFLLLLSWLCLLTSVLFLGLSVAAWWRLHRLCALTVGAVGGWLLCLALLQLALMLHM